MQLERGKKKIKKETLVSIFQTIQNKIICFKIVFWTTDANYWLCIVQNK